MENIGADERKAKRLEKRPQRLLVVEAVLFLSGCRRRLWHPLLGDHIPSGGAVRF
jgi:hypothetical protein